MSNLQDYLIQVHTARLLSRSHPPSPVFKSPDTVCHPNYQFYIVDLQRWNAYSRTLPVIPVCGDTYEPVNGTVTLWTQNRLQDKAIVVEDNAVQHRAKEPVTVNAG